MEKRRLLLGISLYIIFLPILTLLLAKLILLFNFSILHSSAHPFRFLYSYSIFGGTWRTSWERVSLYIALGLGVSYLNNAARLGAIALTGLTAILGVMEFITVVFNISPVIYDYVLKTYGLDDAILPAAILILFISANAIAVFYLTRPKVKNLFKR